MDGTQLYSGSRQLNAKCLERHYNKGTEKEIVNYHSDVLEAKIVLGEKLIVSIASEFIENNGEDAELIYFTYVLRKNKTINIGSS